MSMATVAQVHSLHKSLSLLDFLDRPIAFHRVFATLAGSAAAGLMLSQAFYWTRTMRRKWGDAWDGWFYKTQEEWYEETALGRSEQETARKALRHTTFWQEKRCGLPAKLYFHLELDELEQALLQLPAPPPLMRKKPQQNHQNAGFQQTSMSIPRRLDCEDPADQNAEIPQTITETTTETTSEIFPEIDPNVANVESEHEQPKRRVRLRPSQQDLVAELEDRLKDRHSRGAFVRMVSDHGLGEDIARRLLGETMEQKAHVRVTLGAYFIDLCQREARRQGIDLGFTRVRVHRPQAVISSDDCYAPSEEPDDCRPPTIISLGAERHRDPAPRPAPSVRPLGSGPPWRTIAEQIRAIVAEPVEPTLQELLAKRQAREVLEASPLAVD